MQAVEGGGGRRALRLHRSNDPQLRPNTLFKGCSRELFLCSCPLSFLLLVSTSLLSRGSCPQFVCLRRRSQAFSLSLVENNNASHIQITPPSQPACLHTLRDKLSFTGLDRNKPTDDCLPASEPGWRAGRAHFRRIIRPLPFLSPSLQMIFSQRFPCGKAGYDGEREGINYSASTTNRPRALPFLLSFLPPLSLFLLPPSWADWERFYGRFRVGREGSRAAQRGVKQCFCCCVLIKPVNGSLMSLYDREGVRKKGRKAGEGEGATLRECE